MVTDYAQRNKTPKRNSKNIILTIIVLLIAILLPLTMFYVRYQKTAHHKIQKPVEVKKTSLPSKKPSRKTPQFDFYTLLPKMGVPIPKTNSHSSIAQNEKATYALQIYTVRSQRDARQLRKQLTRMGYRAYTQAYRSTSGNTCYRVLLGPYETIYAADSDQRRLHNKNRLDSLLLTIHRHTAT